MALTAADDAVALTVDDAVALTADSAALTATDDAAAVTAADDAAAVTSGVLEWVELHYPRLGSGNAALSPLLPLQPYFFAHSFLTSLAITLPAPHNGDSTFFLYS